jgi:hypothetical protein
VGPFFHHTKLFATWPWQRGAGLQRHHCSLVIAICIGYIPFVVAYVSIYLPGIVHPCCFPSKIFAEIFTTTRRRTGNVGLKTDSLGSHLMSSQEETGKTWWFTGKSWLLRAVTSAHHVNSEFIWFLDSSKEFGGTFDFDCDITDPCPTTPPSNPSLRVDFFTLGSHPKDRLKIGHL